VQVVPGGYRATARWDFASGSRQAAWLGAHVRIVEADGTTRLKPSGAPEVRTILFPVSSATMYDVWDVIGLNGTGTDSYSVDNLFIPEKFAALRDDPTALREKGPLYRITTYTMYGLGFAAVSLGVARATLDAAIDLSRGKASFGLKAMRENNAVQGALGRTEGNLRAARAYLYATANEVWRDLTRPGGEITEQHRIALRLASTWTIHQAAAVVDSPTSSTLRKNSAPPTAQSAAMVAWMPVGIPSPRPAKPLNVASVTTKPKYAPMARSTMPGSTRLFI